MRKITLLLVVVLMLVGLVGCDKTKKDPLNIFSDLQESMTLSEIGKQYNIIGGKFIDDDSAYFYTDYDFKLNKYKGCLGFFVNISEELYMASWMSSEQYSEKESVEFYDSLKCSLINKYGEPDNHINDEDYYGVEWHEGIRLFQYFNTHQVVLQKYV